MKFHCGQMWIAYISDYGSAERPRNRKTGVNHLGANLCDAVRKSLVHKYTGGRIKIHATQQKTATTLEHRNAPSLPFATSHPRRVYRSFYARDLKKTIYSEICRLYISLWSVRVGNNVVPSAAFSLPSRPPYFTACPLVPLRSHTPGIFIFITTTSRALLSQQISCHRCANRS